MLDCISQSVCYSMPADSDDGDADGDDTVTETETERKRDYLAKSNGRVTERVGRRNSWNSLFSL